MQRKKSHEEIASEINTYSSKLVYADKMCKQTDVIFRLTRSHLKKMTNVKSKLCFVEKASLREGVIILICRYVIGTTYDHGDRAALLGEQFEIAVDRYNAMSVARVYRKRFGASKEFGVIG